MSLSLQSEKLGAAVRHHEAGRLPQAEALYRELLAEDPRQVDALHLLGVLSGQTGREGEAVALITEAIAFRPDMPAQYNNLGNVLRQMGRFGDAICAFRTAVLLDPAYARAWNNLGNALKDDRQADAAIDAYSRSLQLRPDVAEVHSNLGIALREQGRVDEAIAAHRRAVALAPDSSESYNNLGVALRDMGLAGEALDAHEQAVALGPNSLSASCNLGAAQRRTGKVDEAVETLHRVLKLDANYADAHNNLGSALIDRGDVASAETCCRRAISLRPDYADAHGNLAIALAYQGRVEEAMTEARLAVQFMSEQPLAHWNLSMLLLLVGDFDLGWREHEWRWKCPSMLKARQFKEPRWHGEPLDGQTVLLFAEQGFGDMLQFVRYAPLVAQCGGQAIVECQPELHRLLAGMPGVARFVRLGEAIPHFELQCPLMSLPFAMQGRALVPPPVPYLAAGTAGDDARHWQIDFSCGMNIGLVWAGDRAHQNDRARSISLELLAPLAKVSGVTFHSLQKGPAAGEIIRPPRDLHLIDHAAELSDFAATASLIRHLDLVITVDTAVAHLAGAMGKPTWVLLPFMPDWRWMLHRSDSDWYPTLRLFRQEETNQWDAPIERLAQSLGELAGSAPLRVKRIVPIV